jgi:hypothetical protein
LNLQQNVEIERPYLIKGSLIFHKSILLGTHLTKETTKQILNFCFFSNLLSKKKDNPSSLIIEKVYLKDKEKSHVLVLNSSGETLFGYLLQKVEHNSKSIE